MNGLRVAVIKLAKEVPELRKHLVPLLQKVGMEFPTEEARKKYMEEHPKADPHKHTVKKDKDKGDKKEGPKPSGKKTKIHDIYSGHPVLQEAFDMVPAKYYDKEEGYSIKPIKDAVKALKKKLRPDQVKDLLLKSEKAYGDATEALSKAHQTEEGWNSPEYKELTDGPHARAMNVWRVVRLLRDEAKEHPKSFGGGKAKLSDNPHLKELGDKSEWTQAKASELMRKLKKQEAGISVPSGPGYGSAKAKQKEIGDAITELSNWQLEDSGKKKDNKTYKKKYSPQVELTMDLHKLTDADADEVKAFKKGKPQSGVKVPPAELLRRFLSKAKPETKERMKGVTPAEFIKMLAAIMEEEA